MVCHSRLSGRGRKPVPAGWAVVLLVFLVAAAALPAPAAAQAPGTIWTVAGTGVWGNSGDGGPATAAQIKEIFGIAVDKDGNLYLTGLASQTVRKVTATNGIISTVAGTGVGYGSTGDGGLATAANLGGPIRLAVDGDYNLYISEYIYFKLRKVSGASGIIETVVGTGVPNYNGDNIPATSAQIRDPWGIAVSPNGDFYFAESSGPRIRKVTAATGLISTVAGTGVNGDSGDGGPATAAQFMDPKAVALDSAGNLFILDYRACRVRMVDAATQIITTVAGTGSCGFSGDRGPATLAQLNLPYGLAADAAGDIYIADTDNLRIRHVSAATGIISTIAGVGSSGSGGDGGPATQAQFIRPVDVAVNAWGEVFVADASDNRIRLIVPRDLPVITWTNPAAINTGTPLGAGQLNATATVPGTFVYDPPAGTTMSVGTAQTLSVTFIPDDLGTYAPTAATVTLDVQKGVAPIAWAVPAAVPAGTVLGPAQLNATSTLPGTFVYDPPAGTVVTATVQLWVVFTPDDAANYSNAMADVMLTVTTGPVNGPPYTLTITTPTGGRIQGAGINCGAGSAACSVTMPASMTLGIGATASAGFTFTAWTGDCSGSNPSLWVALNGPRTCSATFTPTGGGGGGLPTGPPYTLTITPPTGGKVQGAGLSCGAGGTACSVTMPASMTLGIGATASTGYTFAGWTGDCAGVNPNLWVALDGPRTCGASFTPAGGSATYQLTIAPAPAGGTVTGAGLTCGTGGSACVIAFGGATTATLTATPATGYAFTSWGGACAGISTETTVLVDAARTCSATFTATGGGGTPPTGPPYTLTITSPAGGTIAGAGINCGAGGTACSVTMPAAMTLGVSATASIGYVFTSWTGDCTGTSPSQWIALNGPRTCSATFTPIGGGGGGGLPTGPPYTLTITPPTGGRIQGAGINCGAGGTACSVTMPASMTLGMSATASAGFVFGGWTGDCSGTNPSLWVALSGPRTCGATFVPSGGAGD